MERAESTATEPRHPNRAQEDAGVSKSGDGAAMTLGLLELVEDCHRALESLEELDVPDSLRQGLDGMRLRVIGHFERLGYRQLDPLGDEFDPRLHQAISVEAGPGPDGAVVKVHRRGWQRGEQLLVAALVTVRQGEQSSDPTRRRRRPRRAGENLEPPEALAEPGVDTDPDRGEA
jgi:molecular chaperone GrpE (heat shock protein)